MQVPACPRSCCLAMHNGTTRSGSQSLDGFVSVSCILRSVWALVVSGGH
jgi:hypothetical protein